MNIMVCNINNEQNSVHFFIKYFSSDINLEINSNNINVQSRVKYNDVTQG